MYKRQVIYYTPEEIEKRLGYARRCTALLEHIIYIVEPHERSPAYIAAAPCGLSLIHIFGVGSKVAGAASKIGGGALSTVKGALNVGGAGLNVLGTTVGPVAAKLGGGFMSLLGTCLLYTSRCV